MTLARLLQIMGFITPAEPAKPALPPPETVELALHIARFLPVSSLLKLAQVNVFWRDLARHPFLWNRFLAEKFRSANTGEAKTRFLNEPRMRHPKAQLLGWYGQLYVLAGVLAGTSNHPISRILRGELTREEQDLFTHIDLLVRHGNLSIEEQVNLNNPVIRAYIATHQLTIEEAKVLTEKQRLNLRSTDVQAYIAIEYLTLSQAKDLTEDQFATLKSTNVQTFIHNGSLTFSRALTLTRDQRLNLESYTLETHMRSGALSFDDRLNLTPLQRQNLESSLVHGWISRREIAFVQGKDLAPDQYITISRKHGHWMHFLRLMEGTGTDLASRIIREGVPASLDEAYTGIINRIKRANPDHQIFWAFRGVALRPIAGFLLAGQITPEKMTNESCNKLHYVFERSTPARAFFMMGLISYNQLLTLTSTGILNLNNHELQKAILVDRTLTVKQAISSTAEKCAQLIIKQAPPPSSSSNVCSPM